jgi:amino acid transporter
MRITIGAMISMSGYAAGSALLAPRSLEILCEDGFLPRIGGRYHPRFQTPYVAIVFIAVCVWIMTFFLKFENLVDVSSFVVVLQYAATCLAVPILRRRISDTAMTYRMPGGWTLPLAGVAVSVLFASQIKVPELMWTIGAVVTGFIASFAYRHFIKSHPH